MDVEQELLNRLNADAAAKLDSMTVANELNVPHQSVVGATKSLQGDGYLVATMKEMEKWKLSSEAVSITESGSPEFLLWTNLASSGETEQAELQQQFGKEMVVVALSNGMKAKLFKLKKDAGKVFVSNDPKVEKFEDGVRVILTKVVKGEHIDPKTMEPLKKRKLASLEKIKTFDIVRGPQFAPKRVKKEADLTVKMVADGSWKDKQFKELNFNARGLEPHGGHLHPLLKVRQEFREIFLELGFHEMDTQQWVESSFWNFDTLFVPQKHPARDAQDTFFISKPECCAEPSKEYLENVKKTHEEGYVCDFSHKETLRNVLRTHTTGVSSWVLYHLAQSSKMNAEGKKDFKAGRYFSIDRVFRNEEMDKTHLCEFHQMEGFIIDRNLSLANMMHTLEQFFRRIGVENLRFKPAYNPYTEPSMEIFGYHTGMKKWMEVGNSGMFRPEMLKPMGFDDDVTAIAWGLSLERPTMIKYDIKNIHELFGHKVDLRFIRRSKIARY